jgi:hypothetical protein
MHLFFPIHRPRVGLSFTERGLALVELRRGWGKPSIARINERALPEGLLTLSSSELNVKDRTVLVKELRTFVAALSDRTIAVCLPDCVGHLAVFPFETLPSRERERETILRWRFQHEEHVTVGDARILHRVFPVQGPRAATPAGLTTGGQVTAYLVALAIKRSVLNQYEQVCLEAGLLPHAISCAALWLFDFYRPLFTQVVDLFFVHQASDSMTFFAIRQGLPVFCRMKAQRPGHGDKMNEVRSTLQFYDDLHPPGETGAGSGSIPIYMVGEGASQRGHVSNSMVEVSHVTTRKQANLMNQSILPDWKALVSTKNETVPSEGGLYALACVGGR